VVAVCHNFDDVLDEVVAAAVSKQEKLGARNGSRRNIPSIKVATNGLAPN
jgi:hypothetical protein